MAAAVMPEAVAESVIAQLIGPMEVAAERAEKRGERLLREADELAKQGRVLLTQAAELGCGAVALRQTMGEPVEPEEEIAPANGSLGPVTLERARDAARALGDFKRPELAEKLGVSLIAVGRWLNHLQTHGYITAEGQTRNRHFVWNEQKDAGLAFLQQRKLSAVKQTPEQEVIDRDAPVAQPVAGTGKSGAAGGSSGKMIRDLHSECRAAGCTISRMGNGHWRITLPSGDAVTHSSTPGGSSAFSSFKDNILEIP